MAAAAAFGAVVLKWLQRNGKPIAAAGGGVAVGAAITAICKEKNFKKRVKQIEKDNAIKFGKEQKRKMEELRKKYEHNEEQLRAKVTEYFRSQGHNVSF